MAADDGVEGSESARGYAAVGWAEARLAAPVVGGGGAGGFVVDPERAEACIVELTRIVNDLRLQAMMQAACAFDAPGYDDVSLNLAVNGRVMAQRAEQFVRAWADQIEATRDALQLQLDGYSTTEDTNRRLL
ncbi:PE domain-containing protein [Pseudonocardia hydrocarbonoxydans]|uniref:PE domain-containing protein n=1 Tax=Pseudonocardia hydrocarbonoxydans TaxID=76726 RepID=A0A4Y3WN08_9PSEU|nr:PE domain-containing protein [Pseudonocardia hydrocarbonoxydans]GEC19878.1 hypothetical protein PHY01_21610 [Pseudonocardia hydrocarbonoxydans]